MYRLLYIKFYLVNCNVELCSIDWCFIIFIVIPLWFRVRCSSCWGSARSVECVRKQLILFLFVIRVMLSCYAVRCHLHHSYPSNTLLLAFSSISCLWPMAAAQSVEVPHRNNYGNTHTHVYIDPPRLTMETTCIEARRPTDNIWNDISVHNGKYSNMVWLRSRNLCFSLTHSLRVGGVLVQRTIWYGGSDCWRR